MSMGIYNFHFGKIINFKFIMLMSKYSIPFKILSTNHIIIDAVVNNVAGKFLIDTGASNSCIDLNKLEKFKLKFEKSYETASSATGEIYETYISKKNSFLIGGCSKTDFDLILFDMKSVTQALKEKDKIEVDGIIGSDILIEFNSQIDYMKNEITLEF